MSEQDIYQRELDLENPDLIEWRFRDLLELEEEYEDPRDYDYTHYEAHIFSARW